uniref:Protein RRP5 homolog n=1 Tax=Saccoglossus kowalevskii TaxID=10224 RepID=A0ABM0MCT6_SACKO
MLLLGAVKEIHEYELIISLPHGLTGYVAITDISDVYNRLLQRFTDGDNEDLVKEDLPSLMDYFNIGQYVSCAVKELNTAVKGVRRTQLTLLSRVVNQTYTPSVLKYGQVLSGVVKSQEDHGYMIDLGITGVQAFLNHRYAKVYIDMKNNGQSLLVGQPVECCIKEVMSNGRSVTLTINPNKITKTVANKKKYPYLHMVVPGTRVKATVTEVHEDLLKVDFLEYSGFINHFHLPHFSTKCSHYKKGQEVTACILYNNASTKTVGLSLQTSLCEKLEKSSLHHNLRIGKICKKAVIKKIDGNHGILLQLKIVQSSEVYVLHTQVSDKTIEGSLKEHFTVGSKVMCRIIGYNYLDGLVLASMKSSVISQKFLTYSDIKVGMKIEAKIKAFYKSGLNVEVSDRIQGFIPRLHIDDVPLTNPLKKYKEGDKLLCRVSLP